MGLSCDVIYISDDVKRTFGELSKSGSLKEIYSTQLSGMFWTGERVQVISLANLPERCYGMRYRRVVWDTEKQPDVRLMSQVEARRCG